MEIAFIVCVVLFCFVSILYLIQDKEIRKLKISNREIKSEMLDMSFDFNILRNRNIIVRTLDQQLSKLKNKIKLLYTYLDVEEKESKIILQKKTKVQEETKTNTV